MHAEVDTREAAITPAAAARVGPLRWKAVWRAPVQVLASAALLGLAVPPDGITVVAWVALVPLVLALQGKSPAKAALLGAAFGAVSLAAMHPWFFALDGANVFNTAALFGYLALYPALWCAALALLIRKKLPWVFPGAVLWVLLDWLRGHAGFLALPWDPLSHSQVSDLPLLQLAAFGGAGAIAFVVCLTNLALARAVEQRDFRSLAAPLALLAAAHAAGYLRLHSAASAGDLAVALVQPANEGAPRPERFRALVELTKEAAGSKPNLIVWPESAVHGFAFIPSVAKSVAEASGAADAPILFGSADFGKYAKEAGDRAERIEFKNEAFLMLPDGTVRGPVIKNRLVPFAEYMPLAEHVTWPRWLVARQLHGIAGAAPELITLRNGVVAGVSICWENMFADQTRALVDHGASIIVQLSNDGDFGVSAEPAQHNAASVLRAVEYGRPIVLASSNGPSRVIDEYGRTLARLDAIGVPGWVVAVVSRPVQTTTYHRWSSAWAWLAAGAAAVLLVLGYFNERKQP